MDKKTFIQALGLSLLIIGLWMGWNWWKERNTPPTPPADQTATTQPSITKEEKKPDQKKPEDANKPAEPPKFIALSSAGKKGKIVIGRAENDDPTYAMAVELAREGAAVEDVTLNGFTRVDAAKFPKDAKPRYHFEDAVAGDGGALYRAFASQKVTIKLSEKESGEVDLSSSRWEVEELKEDSARFAIHIYRQSQPQGAAKPLIEPVAKIIKTYHLDKRNAASGNLGFELLVEQQIIDERPRGWKTTDSGVFGLLTPVFLAEPSDASASMVINGPTPPPNEQENGADRAIVFGYEESPTKVTSKPTLLGDFKPENAQALFDAPFAWAGESSAYFAAIAWPVKPEKTDESAPGGFLKARAQAVAASEGSPTQLVTLTFSTNPQTIQAANGTTAHSAMRVFLGPKARDVVDSAYYKSVPRHYDVLLQSRGGMCFLPASFSCTAQWLTDGLVSILQFFHFLLKDWGLAIICLVLVVRALLHPITKRAQVKMMQMGKLAPEVEKLKKKYADKPDELNREMMKLYKAQGGAILGCLPMFLQTPIWISLWTALQGTFELRQAPFLYGWLHIGRYHWMDDLAKPDALIPFTYPGIPLYFFGWHMQAINLLPLLMAIVTYVNQKYFMPMPAAVTDEQKQQQKIQRGMTLLFPLMFYNLPSGLNLYYLTSMSLGILESKIIRNHIKKHEELEKLKGPELVPTKATRASRKAGDKMDVKKPEKPGMMERIMAWVQEKQEQAEQMRKETKKDKRK